ncbi:MAG: acyl-CoA/acyl-ACP dehydrogenase [Novosphingobium sp.]|nr:acyl-CoA/acyl-ACP dehydrogenase [Novosphingobium sp.]
MSDEMDLAVLAESFAEVLGAEWPREKAIGWAQTADAAYREDLWAAMAGLGWTALTAPEAQGGLGLGADAALRLHMALGAAVAPAPMLGTTLAVELLATAGTGAQQAAWLPGLADGTMRVAFAAPDDAPLAADGTAVSGTAANLLDAASATHLFLRATRGGQNGWLVVTADDTNVAVERIPLVDTTRTLGTVTLTGADARDDAFIACSASADDAVTRAGMLAIAGDSQGGGEAVLTATIEYLNVREQFGVLIGSFQALKHRVADHQTALVASRELLEYAAGLPADHPQALLYALSAKQHATRTSAEAARDAIQLHGGVGFTAEFVPHLYLKRAKVNEALWGVRASVLDRIADILEAA